MGRDSWYFTFEVFSSGWYGSVNAIKFLIRDACFGCETLQFINTCALPSTQQHGVFRLLSRVCVHICQTSNRWFGCEALCMRDGVRAYDHNHPVHILDTSS